MWTKVVFFFFLDYRGYQKYTLMYIYVQYLKYYRVKINNTSSKRIVLTRCSTMRLYAIVFCTLYKYVPTSYY